MALDWNAYVNAWNNFSSNKKEETKVKEEKKESVPQAVIDHQYEEYVEKHIIDEPEQVVTSNKDFVEMAKVSEDAFESVIGELPDADPTPKPELDAEYTAEEKSVIEPVTETKVKAVKVSKSTSTAKKKAGRPKKTTK